MNVIKITYYSEIPKNYTGLVEWSDGTKIWYKEGISHRVDGPAWEWSDGTMFWYLEGRLYRKLSLKDYVILDHYKGKYGIMWYKLLGEDTIFEWPDISELITK